MRNWREPGGRGSGHRVTFADVPPNASRPQLRGKRSDNETTESIGKEANGIKVNNVKELRDMIEALQDEAARHAVERKRMGQQMEEVVAASHHNVTAAEVSTAVVVDQKNRIEQLRKDCSDRDDIIRLLRQEVDELTDEKERNLKLLDAANNIQYQMFNKDTEIEKLRQQIVDMRFAEDGLQGDKHKMFHLLEEKRDLQRELNIREERLALLTKELKYSAVDKERADQLLQNKSMQNDGMQGTLQSLKHDNVDLVKQVEYLATLLKAKEARDAHGDRNARYLQVALDKLQGNVEQLTHVVESREDELRARDDLIDALSRAVEPFTPPQIPSNRMTHRDAERRPTLLSTVASLLTEIHEKENEIAGLLHGRHKAEEGLRETQRALTSNQMDTHDLRRRLELAERVIRDENRGPKYDRKGQYIRELTKLLDDKTKELKAQMELLTEKDAVVDAMAANVFDPDAPPRPPPAEDGSSLSGDSKGGSAEREYQERTITRLRGTVARLEAVMAPNHVSEVRAVQHLVDHRTKTLAVVTTDDGGSSNGDSAVESVPSILIAAGTTANDPELHSLRRRVHDYEFATKSAIRDLHSALNARITKGSDSHHGEQSTELLTNLVQRLCTERLDAQEQVININSLLFAKAPLTRSTTADADEGLVSQLKETTRRVSEIVNSEVAELMVIDRFKSRDPTGAQDRGKKPAAERYVYVGAQKGTTSNSTYPPAPTPNPERWRNGGYSVPLTEAIDTQQGLPRARVMQPDGRVGMASLGVGDPFEHVQSPGRLSGSEAGMSDDNIAPRPRRTGSREKELRGERSRSGGGVGRMCRSSTGGVKSKRTTRCR